MIAMSRQRIAGGTQARSHEQRNSEPRERAAHHGIFTSTAEGDTELRQMRFPIHWADRKILRTGCRCGTPDRVILRAMAVNADFLRYVLDQLAGLGRVAARRMFGGVGLYHEERFFGLIAGDTLYLKVNDSNRGDYEARGMRRFRPFPDKPYWSMTYYELPADALEDADECAAWARKSVAIAAVPAKPATVKPAAVKPTRTKATARRGKKRGR
jgi:DNA transformation protein